MKSEADIKNPILAANFLGAPSIGLTGIFNDVVVQCDRSEIGLCRRVKARM